MSSSDPTKRQLPQVPVNISIGDDLNWNAPWINVDLRVELPFWLMVDDSTIPVEVAGHTFSVTIKDRYYEL